MKSTLIKSISHIFLIIFWILTISFILGLVGFITYVLYEFICASIKQPALLIVPTGFFVVVGIFYVFDNYSKISKASKTGKWE